MNPRQFDKFVNHWCPEGFHYERFENRLMRAFLAAVSCVDAHSRLAKGEQPIAPLDLFPREAYPEGGTGL